MSANENEIENCTHNCSTCGADCSSRTQEQESFLEAVP